MIDQNKLLSVLENQKILPLFYYEDAQICKGVIQALYSAGIRLIEFTNRGPAALERFREIVDLRNQNMKDLILAVGTIRSTEDAQNFSDLGADVLISPMWDENIAKVVIKRNVPWIPGCMTPHEINCASQFGFHLVKLFPAHVLGVEFIDSIRPVFPEMKYIITGGVDVDTNSIQKWLDKGVIATGLGSRLIDSSLLRNHEFDKLKESISILLKSIQ